MPLLQFTFEPFEERPIQVPVAIDDARGALQGVFDVFDGDRHALKITRRTAAWNGKAQTKTERPGRRLRPFPRSFLSEVIGSPSFVRTALYRQCDRAAGNGVSSLSGDDRSAAPEQAPASGRPPCGRRGLKLFPGRAGGGRPL